MAVRLVIDEDTRATPDRTQPAVWSPVEIRVSAFRGIADLVIDVTTPVTLVTGLNGAGKTSLLEALEFAHTGSVLGADGKQLKQGEYAPDTGQPSVAIRYRDLAGVRQGPNEDLTHSLRRTLGPHKVGVNRWEGGAKDAALQLYRAMEWDTERLPTLMQADRFPRLTQAAQAEFLADWVRGGERGVNLVAQAADDLQRIIAEEVQASVAGFAGNDAMEVALARISERRSAADKSAKQAVSDLAEAQGALAEALAEVRAAGYISDADAMTDALEADLEETAEATRALLEQARNDLQARGEAEASITRWEEQAAQAQVDLAAAQEELAGADWRAADIAKGREEAEHVVERSRAASERALSCEQRFAAALRTAEESKATASREWDIAEKRTRQLEALSETGCCPTCTRPTDTDFAEIINEARVAEQEAEQALGITSGELMKAQRLHVEAAEELGQHGASHNEALDALRTIPQPPDADAIRARVAGLEGRFGALAEQINAARTTVALYPDDLAETVDGLQDALAQHRATTETVKRARDHEQRAATLAAQAEAHAAERLACDRLKRAWQAAQSSQMTGNPALEALLAEVTAILQPVRGWTAGWSGDGPVVLGPGFTRELSRLSDGERLTAGAAWQAAMARRVGLGLCMIDHAAEIDDAAFAKFVEACTAIGEVSGVRFIIARDDPGYVNEEDVQIIRLREGAQE